MRTTILKYIEKNSRVDLGELAVLLGTDEVTVANEIAQMEKEKIERILKLLLLNWQQEHRP